MKLNRRVCICSVFFNPGINAGLLRVCLLTDVNMRVKNLILIGLTVSSSCCTSRNRAGPAGLPTISESKHLDIANCHPGLLFMVSLNY